ncbi:DUF443 family protein [Terribacillus sp. DMT04]|uniref:DUF443 family protein n=1 Tax=Terribacillus sp. DMT04 TaxID=2850441 RepID=UPI001C2C1DEA|nr:DUF443 family protein [Terribacillus sp. DMT04]QXE01473.1 DUF443 domain-containing protein [Terribacillus sp. DMT04]
MSGEIRRVKGNLRYRILSSNGDYYLIDTGLSPWKVISPYLYWISPNPGYKIDKDTALELITSQRASPGKSAKYGLIGGGLSITFSGFLTPLVDRLHIDSALIPNIIITLLLIGLITFTFLLVSKNLKNSIEKAINYNELPQTQIRIYRPNFSHILRITFAHLFSLAVSVISFIVFIQYSNLFILSVGLGMLFLFFFLSGIALDHGKYKIKIK